ncbi:hypothetical protein [Schlesneria paludicola]|uniref:hypothetical protein n=1 Tax=Schlesneria paludicola TaxID=360056 RepID=UPI000299E681|nr:hypothetical protein [Schlesneria paludicola]
MNQPGTQRDGEIGRELERWQMEVSANESSPGFVSQLALCVARFSTSAWIGAASLFVVVSILEVTNPGFDATTKDMLVALRFPMFYLFGSSLIGLGWLGTLVTGNKELPAGRRRVALLLLAAVLLLMVVDYLWIYQPLLQLVEPPGQTKPSSFARYHDASKKINLVGLTFGFVAVLLLNWPARITSMHRGEGALPHAGNGAS